MNFNLFTNSLVNKSQNFKTKYINNISSLQAFQIIRFASLLFINVILAKLKFPQKEIGNYEAILFTAGMVSFFWINGLIRSFLSLMKPSEDKKSEFFTFFVTILTINIFIIINLTVVFFSFNLQLKGINSNYLFYSLIIFLFFQNPSYLIEYIYLVTKKVKNILYYGTISYFFQISIIFFTTFISKNINYTIIALIFSSFFRFCWLIVVLKKHANFQLNKPFFYKHIKNATPLILSTLISGSAQYIDGLIIMSKYNAATFAVFRYGAKELPLTTLLANSFAMGILPEFNKYGVKETLRKIKNYTRKIMHVLFPLTIFLIMISKWLYPLIFNQDFAPSAVIFNIYLLLIISQLLFCQTIFNGLKKNKYIFYISIIELVINVTLSLIFIRFWGIEGVAYATVVAFICERLALMVILKQKFHIKLSHFLPIKLYSFYTIVLITCFIFFGK